MFSIHCSVWASQLVWQWYCLEKATNGVSMRRDYLLQQFCYIPSVRPVQWFFFSIFFRQSSVANAFAMLPHRDFQGFCSITLLLTSTSAFEYFFEYIFLLVSELHALAVTDLNIRSHNSDILVKFHGQKRSIVNSVARYDAHFTQKSLSNQAAS